MHLSSIDVQSTNGVIRVCTILLQKFANQEKLEEQFEIFAVAIFFFFFFFAIFFGLKEVSSSLPGRNVLR